MASFATPSDLALNYDERMLLQLASDTDTPAVTIEGNSIILNALAKATEEILSHARVGKKYTEAELQTLADNTTSGYLLVGLCCDLAYGYMVMRRGTGATDADRLSPRYKLAVATLQRLAEGHLIFPRIVGEEHEQAGTPSTENLNSRSNLPRSYVKAAFRRWLPGRSGPYETGC